ncbi:MAG TPA: PaaI family thioesterase, partial [Candidatus Thermoplasmatota archaeon]|nr:PaaI family thioesterase [Candidatus Thermoplasmatota archaeon]
MGLADDVAEMAAGRRPLPAFDRHMGFRLAGRDADGVVLEADIGEASANATGAVHGGLVAGLADSAMGLTVSGMLAAGTTCTNVDLHLRFLRPPGRGTLRAYARVLRWGRNVVSMECDVEDGQGRLVARAASTFL